MNTKSIDGKIDLPGAIYKFENYAIHNSDDAEAFRDEVVSLLRRIAAREERIDSAFVTMRDVLEEATL